MDESAWQACTLLMDLLQEVRRKKSPWKWTARQARLFACACCRRVWSHLGDDQRTAVAVAEKAADKLASRGELDGAHRQAQPIILFSDPQSFATPGSKLSRGKWNFMVYCGPQRDFFCNPGAATARPTTADADEAANDCRALLHFRDSPEAANREEEAQCDLLRMLVGPADRPAIDAAWLSWQDKTVPRLARAACEARELPSGHLERGQLAVLADALEEAGCSAGSLLTALRGPTPLVRGCWAIEGLLGDR